MHLSKTDKSMGLSAAFIGRICISVVPELCQPNFLSILLLFSNKKFLGRSDVLHPQNIIQIIGHRNCTYSPGTLKFRLHCRSQGTQQQILKGGKSKQTNKNSPNRKKHIRSFILDQTNSENSKIKFSAIFSAIDQFYFFSPMKIGLHCKNYTEIIGLHWNWNFFQQEFISSSLFFVLQCILHTQSLSCGAGHRIK